MSTCRHFAAPLPWPKPSELLPELQAPPSFPIGQLLVIVEWSTYCEYCDQEKRFVADRWCKFGLIGECTGCGEERIAPFTRTQGGE